jgi:phosphoribosylglycinamide formyltransferase-1
MSEPSTPSHNQQSLRIAVLASGNGSNLQAIIDQVHGKHGVELITVVSDKPGAKALARAEAAGIPTAAFPIADYELNKIPTWGGGTYKNADPRASRDAAITEHLREHTIDLVVLAGYMQILSRDFIAAFNNRIINVHPSLLPKYPGLRAIEQALEAGDTETGVTVHFVDEGVDTGPVIVQETLDISPSDTAETLAERVHAIEHRLLPEVIAQIAAERVDESRILPASSSASS